MQDAQSDNVEIWGPVLGGCLIGLSAGLTLLLYGRLAGISGILARARERDGRTFRAGFLGGLVGVGLLVALLAPDKIGPPMGGIGAMVGAGLLVGLGTTVGHGCTSGHGVCGIGRGSMRSLVAVMVFMASAMVTVALGGAS
ncbi:MAG: YeeE/YedE family protein [Kofleriaceae bacterium]